LKAPLNTNQPTFGLNMFAARTVADVKNAV